MKKWMLSSLCLCCLFTLFLSGCKTPPKDTKPVEEVKPVEVAQNGTDLTAANEKLKSQIAAARQKAIDAGAQRCFPNELSVIDKDFSKVRSAYDAGADPAEFNQKAADFVYQYRALEQASLARADREKITDMGFEKYARAQFESADKAALKTEEMFKTGASSKDLYDQSKAAADGYRAVLQAGYKILAEKERDKVLELKKKADEIKSSVADKDGYANAVAFYTRASQELNSGAVEEAYNNFVSAYDMLNNVYQGVLVIRSKAEEAMARAKRRVDESNAVAVKADSVAPVEEVEAIGSVENTKEAQ